MILLISAKNHQLIQKYAEQTYPEECCGLLLGVHQILEGEKINVVKEIYPTPNVWERSLSEPDQPDSQKATSHRRYRIDPVSMLKAQQYARANNWDITGIYHSHPNAAAVPSEWDRAWAWPEYSYIIVSLKNGMSQDLRNWILDDISHKFLSEKMIVPNENL
jgi:proteasome lid subunit RPN8/RPN11